MSFQATVARIAGDAWKSWRTLALWPWPAICIGYPKAKFDWTDYRRFCHAIKPGDMLLMTAERYFLSNRGIAGTAFKHLGVYTGPVMGLRDEEGFITRAKSLGEHFKRGALYDDKIFDRTITHAVSEGVVCQDLGEVLFHEDYVVAVRPWRTESERKTIVLEALEQVGKGYNFDFTQQGPPELYCTELGEYCCIRAGIIAPQRVKMNVDWKGIFLPLDRYRAYVAVADKFVLHFPIVSSSKHCDNRGFWAGSAWSEDLRRKILNVAE